MYKPLVHTYRLSADQLTVKPSSWMGDTAQRTANSISASVWMKFRVSVYVSTKGKSLLFQGCHIINHCLKFGMQQNTHNNHRYLKFSLYSEEASGICGSMGNSYIYHPDTRHKYLDINVAKPVSIAVTPLGPPSPTRGRQNQKQALESTPKIK